MENNKIDYLKPVMFSIVVGLLVASLSQSCGTTKASIGKLITPVTIKPGMPYLSLKLKPSDANSLTYRRDSSFNSLESSAKPEKAKDTTNYNRLILDNQQISLGNEKRILELLMMEKQENNKLKQEKNILSQKSKVTQEEKEDAISMQAIWNAGKWVVTGCFVIIAMLILVIIFLLHIFRKRAVTNY